MLLPFFLNYWLSMFCLIPAVITQICNPILELGALVRLRTIEAKEEMETHAVIVEIKLSEFSI